MMEPDKSYNEMTVQSEFYGMKPGSYGYVNAGRGRGLGSLRTTFKSLERRGLVVAEGSRWKLAPTEQDEYVEALKSGVLQRFGIGIDTDECLSWLEADLTVDQALGWMDHGCGPGDAAGCWTQDPVEAFAESGDE